MSCPCGCNPCNCLPSPSTCCTPTTETVEYTFENANLAGVGVFDNETDNLVQFRGIVSDSVALTVTLNATDNTIVLNFDDESLIADIPDATTTQRGILETATNAEALAKAALDKILTPSNLAALGSTTTFAGLVELATNAEAIAGVSTTVAVTPAALKAASDNYATVTFADAVARNAATPAFAGQLGAQLDTAGAYVGASTTAGDWNQLLTLGAVNTATTGSTTLNMNATVLTLVGNGDLILTNTNFEVDGGNSEFHGGETTFGVVAGASQIVNFANAVIHLQSNPFAAEAVLGVNASSEAEAFDLNTFVSDANTQLYGAATGTVARTAFATYAGQAISNPPTQAEVQALDDAVVIVSQRLGALINDLRDTLKPHGA